MGADAVEEVSVVGDDHRAAREVHDGVFEDAHGVDVQVVGRLVQQNEIPAAPQEFRQMDAVALAARELPDELLLGGTTEVELGDVGAAVDEFAADIQVLLVVGDFLIDGAGVHQFVAVLVDVGELDGFAKFDGTGVGRVQSHEHAEEGGLASAIWTDDAHHGAWRDDEVRVLDEFASAGESLAEVTDGQDLVTQTRTRRNLDGQLVALQLEGLRGKLVVSGDAGLVLLLAGGRLGGDPLQFAGEDLLAGGLALLGLTQQLGLLLEP